MPQLGNIVRDKVTGFKGMLLGKCEYLTGCTQFLVVPKMKKNDDKRPGGEWFDDGRLEVLETGITKQDVAGAFNGGPQHDAPPTR